MNLLPDIEKKVIRDGLRIRFIIIASLLISASFLIGLILLLPVYFLASNQIYFGENQDGVLKNKEGQLAEEILNLPQEIDSKLEFFQSSIINVSPVKYISEIVRRVESKIILNSILFLRDSNLKDKKGILISISGVANDRDALIAFGRSLRESKVFSSVDIPVSNLTKDKNLPFSMNIFIDN